MEREQVNRAPQPRQPRPSYALAMACGADAAQRQATREGRATWDESDWQLATKVANDVCLAAGLITHEQHRELTCA